MLEKLLVPLDGSLLGELALDYAGELAAGMGSEVRMVCATERRDDATLNVCNTYLSRLIEKLGSGIRAANPRSNIKMVVIDGAPANALLRYAENEGIGLIVFTSHGHGGILPWPMGGTADKIMHHSHVPVLMVRAGQATEKREKVGHFRKILLPLDGSPMGEAAVPYVREISTALGSEVVLLRVVETEVHVHTVGGPDHFLFSEQQVAQMKEEATAYLEGMSMKFLKGKVKKVVRTGDPAHEILKAAVEEVASLLAMSSHGKSGIAQWVLGSVTNKMLHADETALLLVRPPARPPGAGSNK